MPFNFKQIQNLYPDALRLQLKLLPGRSLTTEQLVRFCGGGKVLHESHSKDGRTVSVVVSKLAAARYILIYGPQGSGKTTLAKMYANLFEGSVTVPYSDLIDVPSDTECLVIEGWPACVSTDDVKDLYNEEFERIEPKCVIITMQVKPNKELKPREGFYLIKTSY